MKEIKILKNGLIEFKNLNDDKLISKEILSLEKTWKINKFKGEYFYSVNFIRRKTNFYEGFDFTHISEQTYIELFEYTNWGIND